MAKGPERKVKRRKEQQNQDQNQKKTYTLTCHIKSVGSGVWARGTVQLKGKEKECIIKKEGLGEVKDGDLIKVDAVLKNKGEDLYILFPVAPARVIKSAVSTAPEPEDVPGPEEKVQEPSEHPLADLEQAEVLEQSEADEQAETGEQVEETGESEYEQMEMEAEMETDVAGDAEAADYSEEVKEEEEVEAEEEEEVAEAEKIEGDGMEGEPESEEEAEAFETEDAVAEEAIVEEKTEIAHEEQPEELAEEAEGEAEKVAAEVAADAEKELFEEPVLDLTDESALEGQFVEEAINAEMLNKILAEIAKIRNEVIELIGRIESKVDEVRRLLGGIAASSVLVSKTVEKVLEDVLGEQYNELAKEFLGVHSDIVHEVTDRLGEAEVKEVKEKSAIDQGSDPGGETAKVDRGADKTQNTDDERQQMQTNTKQKKGMRYGSRKRCAC